MVQVIRCEGWWEQSVFGKQWMQDLRMEFVNGVVTGRGTDIVGPFELWGSLDGGRVTLWKHYTGKHRVEYCGEFDGEGSMQGTWHIGGDTGRWAIRVLSGGAEEATVEQILPG